MINCISQEELIHLAHLRILFVQADHQYVNTRTEENLERLTETKRMIRQFIYGLRDLEVDIPNWVHSYYL